MNPFWWETLRAGAGALAAVVASYVTAPLFAAWLSPLVIPLAWVCFATLRQGPLPGMIAAVVAGLALDFTGPGALGVNLAALAITSFACHRVGRLLGLWPLPVRALSAASLSFLYVPVTLGFAALAGQSLNWTARSSLLLTLGSMLCVTALIFISPRTGNLHETPSR